MNKNAEALLKKVGFTKEQIKAIVTPDAELDVDTMFGEVNAAISEAMQNDPAFIDPLRKEWQGEVLGSKERQLLQLVGDKVTKEEVAGLPKKDRFIKLVELVMAKQAPAEGGKPADKAAELKEIEKLNKELAEAQSLVKDYKEVQEPKWKQAVVDVEDGFSLDGYMMNAMTANGRKTVMTPAKILGLIKGDIGKEADYRWNRKTGKVDVFQKGTELPIHDPNDRSKKLGIEDLITTIGEREKYFAKNNGKEEGGQRVHTPAASPAAGVNEPPGLAAARARQNAAASAEA